MSAKQYQIYLDKENGIYYLFTRAKLMNAFYKAMEEKNLKHGEMCAWLSDKMIISENKKHRPEDTIINNFRTDKKSNNPRTINIIKQYGKLLEGNELAFLAPLPANEAHPEAQPKDSRGGAVYTVFRLLYKILECYEESSCFNYIPGTDDADGAWDHFEGEINKVKKELEAEFLGNRDSVEFQKLSNIIRETETFVKSYSVPGVVWRWREINPRLNYFHCAFDLIEEYGPETVKRLKREGLLDYLPSCFDIEARSSYFNLRKHDNERNNFRYSEEKIFQNELLQSLAMVFGEDFRYLNFA